MKKIVTYQIRGQVERSCTFKAGKALLRIEFTGGSICSSGMVPAQYTTDSPLYQHAIENSEYYQRGEIMKSGEMKIEDKAETVALSEEENNKKGEVNSHIQVTNMQQARNVLMGEPFCIPLIQLQSKAEVKAKAAELGVTFPRWN